MAKAFKSEAIANWTAEHGRHKAYGALDVDNDYEFHNFQRGGKIAGTEG